MASGGGGPSKARPARAPAATVDDDDGEGDAFIDINDVGEELADLDDGDRPTMEEDDLDDVDEGAGGSRGPGVVMMMGDDGEEEEGEEEEDEDEDGEGRPRGPPPPEQAAACFSRHTDSVYAVAWSPVAADIVASGGGDDRAFLVNVAAGGAGAPAPASAEEAGGAEERPAEFGIAGVAELAGHGDSIAAVAFSADGALLATGGLDGKVLVWRVAAAGAGASDAPRSPLCTLEGPAEGIEWLAWHPRGHVLLAGSEDATTWMWTINAASGEGTFMQVYTGHAAVVRAGGFTCDGKAVVTASADASLRVWSPKTGEALGALAGHPYHGGPITCLDLHRENAALALTGAEDGSVRVANLASAGGKVAVAGSLLGHRDGVECAAFAGPALAATGGHDGVVIVWDLAQMTARGAPCAHPAGVTCLAAAPGGVLLWTACLDGAVRLWDARSGRCELTRTGHEDAILDLAMSPDGRAVATCSDDGTVRVFRMP